MRLLPHNANALLRHLTNAKIMGQFVQSQRDAWKNFDRFAADSRITFLNEPANLELAFRSLTQATSPSHGLWTDAYLAAFAQQTGAELITFDQGFSRFAKVNVLVLSN